MKKQEVIILITGIIILGLMYYFLSKKNTSQPTIAQPGLIPSANNAINKIGTNIPIISHDISSVANALTSLLNLKNSQTSVDTGSTGINTNTGEITDPYSNIA